jgi:hypothetical protein
MAGEPLVSLECSRAANVSVADPAARHIDELRLEIRHGEDHGNVNGLIEWRVNPFLLIENDRGSSYLHSSLF